MSDDVNAAHYEEREITAPVLLCDKRGRLNPDARGWSRMPLHRCNLSGRRLRKKKWNYWGLISPSFTFSITLADVDYFGLATAWLHDFETGERFDALSITPFGMGCSMPEEVERDIAFAGRKLAFSLLHEAGRIKVVLRCPSMGGREVRADFVIHKPRGHETLNVVVPWTQDRFQFTSKQNTLPAEGSVTVGTKRYDMDPETCHAVLDYGRGIWPYRTAWNWGVVTGRQGNDRIGINMGGKWTDGTGANENGICLNGRLYKVMEDLVWEYDRTDWMKPWRAHTAHSNMVDVTLTPIVNHIDHINFGLISTRGNVSYGRWSGMLRIEGRVVELDSLMGWAEEFTHRW